MSRPRSLRVAFEVCQPLRQSFARPRPPPIHRSFHTSRKPLFAEPSSSPPEVPPNPNDYEPPLEPPPNQATTITAAEEGSSSPPSSASSASKVDKTPPLRAPRSVQAAYLRPLRHPPIYGHPVCSLQLRSFSVRNLEFMADFALRAAYYLGLPAKGPTPLPKIVQRWTVVRSNFIFKKSQENFERITLRRLVQIQDGDADVVKVWLAYLRRYAFWGVGMKANIWEFEGLDVAGTMDKAYSDIEKELKEKLSSFGRQGDVTPSQSPSEWMRERTRDRRLPGVPMAELRRDSRTFRQPHKEESVY